MVAFGGTTAGGGPTVVTPSAIFDAVAHNWFAGPDIPGADGGNYTLADAPAATLPSGSVLFSASPNANAFSLPSHFFELSLTNTIAAVNDNPDAPLFTSFQWNFVNLPNGQVMALETDGSNVWIYTPSGGANAAWAPTVAATPSNLVSGATYHLSGAQLNGLSQGSVYGDDQQAATNYPIIEVVNSASGHVFFGRSFNHSTGSIGVNAPGATSFTMPQNLEPGPSKLSVIANGIASAPVSLNMQRSLYAKSADFNGDHKSDILWRDVNGTVVIWEMNGGAVVGAVGGQVVSNDWRIVGAGDFNGDGKSDILWRNTNGMVVIWEMNGGAILAAVGGQMVSNDWTILGTGDFNGDGKSDILWRNNLSGAVVIWEMNGGAVLASAGNQIVSNDWSIVGIGDFNGDGKSDILWRNNLSGVVVIWEMSGGSILASVGQRSVSNDWTVVGVGDFNGDGKSDILWRNANGTVVIWEMNGGSILASVGQKSVGNDWSVVGVGDFNGDGKADILWRNVNGTVVIWEMSGGTILASVGNQVVTPFLWALLQ